MMPPTGLCLTFDTTCVCVEGGGALFKGRRRVWQCFACLGRYHVLFSLAREGAGHADSN